MLMKKKKPILIISDLANKTDMEATNSEFFNNQNNNNIKPNLIDGEKTKKNKEHKMTEEEKELNRKILKNMNRKQNFVKNPRFRNTSKFMLYSNALFSDILNNENPFVVEPIIVTFREYQLNCIYQIDLKLTNRKQILTTFKYIPPTTENFSIKRIIYPKKDTSLIAPGMHAKIEVLFNATSLDNFEDEISVITETFAFRVPLRAIRESPALSLDNPMMCGKCLLGDQTSMVFRCKNNGGDAHFKFHVKEVIVQSNTNLNSSSQHNLSLNPQNTQHIPNNNNQNFIIPNNSHAYMPNNSNNANLIQGHLIPNHANSNTNFPVVHTNTNLPNNTYGDQFSQISAFHSSPSGNSNNLNSNNQQDSEVLQVGPFSIFPKEFYLYKGMSVEVYVNFNPKTEGIIEKDLLICCDSKINLNHKIIGEGISIDFKILTLDGVPVDESIERLENLYFEDSYPSTIASRTIEIKNLSSVPLRYHWSIYDMYENKKFSLENDEDYFTITPLEGVFEAFQEIIFTVYFQPKNSRNYERKLDLIIEDVPFQAVKNYNNDAIFLNNNNKKENSKNYNSGNYSTKEGKNPNGLVLKRNTFTKGEPFLLALNSPYPSYPIFSFNLRGKGKQSYLDVSSKIIDFGIVYLGEKIYRNFSLYNPKSGKIKFKISKIIQSIKRKTTLADTDPVLNVNNFFKWSDPGSTVTDHFRTNCIFKLRKPNEENFEKIFNRITKEFNNQNNANLDIFSDNEMNSNNNLTNNNNKNNNYQNINNQLNIKTNNELNLHHNLAFNNYLNLEKVTNNLHEEVNYLKFFVNKNFLFKNDNEILRVPKNKWTNKVKNSKFNSNKKIYNASNVNNNALSNSHSRIIQSDENYLTSNNNPTTNNTVNNRIIKRDKSFDSSLEGKKLKQNPIKQIDRISINSAASNLKEKANLINLPNPNENKKDSSSKTKNNILVNYISNNINNALNNLNLQNSLVVDESSFHNKSISRTNVPKSPSGATSTGKNRTNSNSTNKIINMQNQNNFNPYIEESELEENIDLLIKKDEVLKINISFLPNKLGFYKSSIIVNLDDGIPFSIDFKATVIGPKIIVDTPCIDFGLFPINEIRTAKIKIKNVSRTNARYLIKETRFKNINFENYIDSDYVTECEGIIHESKFRKRIESLQEFENFHLREIDIDIIDNYEIKFSPIFGTISPNQEQEIVVTFVSAYPKYKHEQIEVMVMHSDSIFVNWHADCQEAFAYLDKTLINPKSIYVSVPVTYDNNSIKIINPSNLPVNFEWENLNIEDDKYIEFSPKKGTIQPRSSIEITYKMLFYLIKTLDEIYFCKIKELDIPLGVNFKGVVTGLDILYELTDETFQQFNLSKFESITMHSSLTGNSMIKRTMNLKENKKLAFLDNNLVTDKTLNSLDFKNLKVNKTHTIKFIVKNLSGIATNFSLDSKNYNPGVEKDLKYNMSKYPHLLEANGTKYNSTMNSISMNSINSQNNNYNHSNQNYNSNSNNNNHLTSTLYNQNSNNDFNHSSRQTQSLNRKNFFGSTSKKNTNIGHPLLSDYHESINFTSVKGNDFTKMRHLEKDSVLYLSSKKGVAIIIEPKQGRLDPYTEQLISLTIYNECVGDFEDELIAHVKGLPERRFPMTLKIRGNPLQLAPFQPGIDYTQSPPILKMGHVTTNVNLINKSFKVINTGANLISLDWKIFDYDEIINPKGDIFKVKISQNKNKEEFTLNYNAYEAKEVEDFNYFKIAPKNVLIQPKGTQDLNVSFSTNVAGIRSSLLVAYPKFLDDSKTLNVKLSELALKVDAYGVKPNLVVDKKIDFEGNYRYRFYLHSYGTNPKMKRSIVLINQEKINFIIRMQLEGPYKITNTEPLEASVGTDGKTFNIIPKSNLKIEIKTLIPDAKNLEDWPISLVNEKHGKLTVIFENGDFKEYLLTTVLKRPRLALSTTGNDAIEGPNFIDFGSVNCESFKKASIYLKNLTDVLSDWKVNYLKYKPKKYYGYGTTTIDEKEDISMCDDPDMFLFNTTSGEIHGPSIMLMNIPLGPALPQVKNEQNKKFLPIKIDIMFKPKKNIFYKCRYKITSSTGNTIDFILKGYGSYLEEKIEN